MVVLAPEIDMRIVSLSPLFLALAAAPGAVMASDFPATVRTSAGEVSVEQVVSGLSIPWGMAFLPDGRILVTERPGSLRLVDVGQRSSVQVKGVPAVAAMNQGGLLDVQVHPAFGSNPYVYLCHSVGKERELTTRLSRYRLEGDALVDETILFTGEPWLATVHHFGCRVHLDGQGHIYFTIGDRGERDLSQRLDVDAGKVHRIREDGSIPADNPFVGREGARPSVWSYGHRNQQGLAFRPGTQQLWATEHGPRGGDEVNEVRPGLNYGWPVVTYGREYHGPKIGEGTEKEGIEPPRLQWTPSIGPSGLIFYTGDAFPAWKGQMLAGGMALTHLNRLEIAADGSGVEKERLFDDLGWRVRDVEQGPEGHLYLLVDNGWLLRVKPAE